MSGITFENINVDPRSTTGKAAKKFNEAIDRNSFSPEVFAYIIANGSSHEVEQMMRIVAALAACLADQFCQGKVTNETTTGMRIHDTLTRFQ